jgi:hypothetical protein
MSGTPSTILKNDIEAIHGFLAAQAKVTDVTVPQQSQCDNICKRVATLQSLDIPGATALTATVQAGPWTPDQKRALAGCIQSRLDEDATATAAHSRVRRKLQTVSTFEKYLTDDDISVLQDPDVSNLAAS